VQKPKPQKENDIEELDLGRQSRKTVLFALNKARQNKKLLAGMLSQVRQYGWQLLDLNLTNNIIPVGRFPIAGAVVENLPDDPVVEKLIELGIPIIRCGKLPHPMDYKLSTIFPDYETAAIYAAEHLIERNFQQAAFLANDPWGDHQKLYQVFKDRIEKSNCKCHLYKIKADNNLSQKKFSDRVLDLKNWLNDLPKPVGIFTGSDQRAARLSALCLAGDIAVPEEISIIGMGNTQSICESAPVMLSSIEIGMGSIGKLAIQMLYDNFQGNKKLTRETVFFKPIHVIERQSTNVLAVDDIIVGKALRFIWDNHKNHINVDMIARHVLVNRRKLEKAFKKCLNRGVAEELKRKRLEEIERLLRTTKLTLKEIADNTGIGESISLQRAFKSAFSMTPNEYRLKHKLN